MDLTGRNTRPMDVAVEERTDWAVEYRFGNGVLDYAYCDDRSFAESIVVEISGRGHVDADLRVVTRRTQVSADGRRTSTPWAAPDEVV